jgi:hypothetical protein
MPKVMAVLRTLFLVFIVIYMLVELPILAMMSGDSQNIDKDSVRRVAGVAWVAIAWIAFETALAWTRVWLEARRAGKAKPGASPPVPAP